MHLSLALSNMRFITQHLLAVDGVDELLMDSATGFSLRGAVSAILAKLPTLEIQLQRAHKQASTIAAASSSVALQEVCKHISSSATELEDLLVSLTQAQGKKGVQQQTELASTAASIRASIAALKAHISAFRGSMSSAQQLELERHAKGEVARHLLSCTQEDIEGQLHSMHKWQAAVSKEADTSKQRAQLRQKLSQGDARLEQLVANHNKLAAWLQLPEADVAAVKAGDLPWQFDGAEIQPHQVPLKERLEFCEKWQWLQRTREGAKHVLEGMQSYVLYYQALGARLQEAAGGEDVSWGQLAALHRGMAFCRRQLEAAEGFVAGTNHKFQLPAAGAGVKAAQELRRWPQVLGM
jgi:chromosome segregation ATPase